MRNKFTSREKKMLPYIGLFFVILIILWILFAPNRGILDLYISQEEIENCIGPVDVDPSLQQQQQTPRSPGMKYTHYAPTAPLYVTQGSIEWLQRTINSYQQVDKRVGVLAVIETIEQLQADVLVACGSSKDLYSTAHSLYDSIRVFDKEAVDIILAESYQTSGIGAAIMNRLDKAAGHKWLKEID